LTASPDALRISKSEIASNGYFQEVPMTVATQGGEARVVLDNVNWTIFEALTATTGPRRGRLAYEEGVLEIMSPSSEHEIIKSGISLLVAAYAQEMEIDMVAVGSTTLKRQLKQRGVEPDESYYVQNEPVVRGRTDIDLGKDPPPDLVIEVQLTPSSLDKLGLYAAMGVPEVWLWEENRLKVYWSSGPSADAAAPYTEQERSRALPGLSLETLVSFLRGLKEKSIMRLANEFRSWLRDRAQGAR
jgi:Uma2 family endonuclease